MDVLEADQAEHRQKHDTEATVEIPSVSRDKKDREG